MSRFLMMICRVLLLGNSRNHTWPPYLGRGADFYKASIVSASHLPAEFVDIKMTHAVFSSLVFALFMPIAAILIRVCTFRSVLWIHGGFMVISWLMSIISLGTGIWLAQLTSNMENTHAIIGFVVIGGCTIQPITGLIHHKLYKNRGRPNVATYLHIWLGRALITMGTVNGGLGLNIAWKTPQIAIIGYSIGAGFVWLVWMGVIFLSYMRSRGKREGEIGENVYSQEPGEEQMKKVPFPKSLFPAVEKDRAIKYTESG